MHGGSKSAGLVSGGWHGCPRRSGCGAAALASVLGLGLILINVVGAIKAFDDYEYIGTFVGAGILRKS